MGLVERRQKKRGCVDGDNATMRNRKRRRKEGASTCEAPRESRTWPKQVDSSDSRLGSSCAGLVARTKRNKRRRLNDSQNDRHSNDLTGEGSSEKEKQSLLAWVEMGIHSDHYGDVMKTSEGCFEKGEFVKGSEGRYSNGHAHTHSNRDFNGKEVCISNPITHDFMANCEGSKVYSSNRHIFSHVYASERSNIGTNGSLTHKNKRNREVDKVLDYVVKRCIMVKTPSAAVKVKPQTTKTVVIAWGRNIPVTLTSEACAVEEWISSQNGDLFGLDVEWRPNRAKGQRNKTALLQLSNENECLIVQMLFLDRQPQALHKLLADPSKGLAGVGVLADGKRLLHDYGLECQGGIELTTLAVERLKRDELRNVGLKVLVQEVLGLALEKPKRVTLSNWAKEKLDQVQINYACMDAWASFALSKRLLVQT